MIQLLKWLWFGHIHEWEIHREVEMNSKQFAHGEWHLLNGRRYELRCKKCGNMKLFDTV